MNLGDTPKQKRSNEQAKSERLRKAYRTGEYIDEFTATPESPLQNIPPLWRIEKFGRPAYMSAEEELRLYGTVNGKHQ